MGFFSKRKQEEQGFSINTEEDNIKISGDKNLAPHAMTAEEVSALWVFGDEKEETYTNTGALDALKKRMNVSAQQTETVQKNEEQNDVAEMVSTISENHTVEEISEQVAVKEEAKQPDVVQPVLNDQVAEKESVEEITNATNEAPPSTQEVAPVLEKETKTIDNNDVAFTQNNTVSLMEKVKRYTVDEEGHDMSENQKPIYELQSVAEILKTDSEDAMKNLSQKYGVDFSFDNLGKNKIDDYIPKEAPKAPVETPPIAKPKIVTVPVSPTPAFEKMVSAAEKHESRELFESLFPSEKVVEKTELSVPNISDIDTHEVGISNEEPISNTATIRFTPIKDSKGNTDRITITNVTRPIELEEKIPEDISSHSAPQLEKSEFDEFVPEKEFVDAVSGKKLLYSLAKQKRFYFLSSFVSAVAVLVLSVFLLPPVYNTILSNPKTSLLVCCFVLLASILANVNMFFDFKNLFNKRSQFDTLAALCSGFTLGFGLTSAFEQQSKAYYTILLCSVTLFARAFFKFKFVSSKIKCLRQILSEKPKNAVTLINDPATTFAMAKNAIEGDVLALAHKKSNFIKDFIKHFDFHNTISGKSSVIFIVASALSLLLGTTAFFYYDHSIYDALFVAASISCFAALPMAFFIDALPMASATKKLSASNSMIAGIYGAEKIENANAVVVNVNDIFPSGTVTLHNIQVLSNNNIDEILLRAASLTAAVGSPLKAIFEKIAGSNSSYSIPDSDTVKYEKNLGISGWVDDEPLFIGNRSLMMAHGIEIPSLEIDKKILRKGFFPVYVATLTTACALIVIQYNVNPIVAKQLHKVTDLGLLLLVENCDPNVTDQMLCDYFGLYDDSVKIMSNTGLHMYKNAVTPVPSCSAPAVFKGSGLNFIKIVNCASGIKKCNRLLTVLYALFAVMGALYFVYAAFSGIISMPEPYTVLLYSLTTTILSIIGFLIRKP